MAELVKNLYILMILAFLIGLFLGWILRRSATRKKYAQQVDDLSIEHERTTAQLHEHSTEYENNTRGLSLIQDSIKHKQEQIDNYSLEHKTLLSDIEKFKQNQTKLENELEEMDDKIKNATDQLEILNGQKDEILKTKTLISSYEEKISSKEDEIKKVTEEIKELSDLRDATNAKLQNINESIDIKQKEIDAEDQKIALIKDEFKEKTTKLQDELQHSRAKLLNYQYALKYVDEKLEAKEPLSFDTIDKIISKNEETGLFKNLFKKLFSKSANYIAGGK